MPIKIQTFAALLVTVLLVTALGTGCKKSASTLPAETSAKQTEQNTMQTAHFSKFEIPVPEDWQERGNVGKLWEKSTGTGGGEDACFLLAGPLEDSLVTQEWQSGQEPFETAIAEQLELFYNTEFSRGEVSFSYDTFRTPGGKADNAALSYVAGTLQNGRTGVPLHFAGGYSEQPYAYFLYFWGDSRGGDEETAFAEVTYEGFEAL